MGSTRLKQLWLIACATLALAGCSSKYEGWQKVRIQTDPPGAGCQYRAQEVCTEWFIGGRCLEWQKKRAALNKANTVVITSRNKRFQATGVERYRADGHTLQASGGSVFSAGQLDEVIADQYWCPDSYLPHP